LKCVDAWNLQGLILTMSKAITKHEQIRRFADQFDGEPLTEEEALRME